MAGGQEAKEGTEQQQEAGGKTGQAQEEVMEDVKSRKNTQEEAEGMGPRTLVWEGPGPLPPIPHVNFAAFILDHLAQHGEAVALVDAGTGKHHTYGDVCRVVPRVRSGLASAGVGPRDAVLLLTPNHIDFPVVLLAVVLRGAVCVPMSTSQTPEEVGHAVRVSGARWAVVHEAAVATAEQAFALQDPGTLQQMWLLGHHPRWPSLAHLMRTSPMEAPQEEAVLDPRQTVAMMPFSSGTTGPAKGVMLSHTNLLTSFHQSKYLQSLSPPGGPNPLESLLLLVPACHSYGYTILFSCLCSGGKAVMLPRFTPDNYFQAIETYRVTVSPIVPHIARFLTETPLMQQYDLSSLMTFFVGSSAMDSTTFLSLMDKSGKTAGEGYGLTECGTVAINGGPGGFQLSSVGKILPYLQAKVVEVDSRRTLGPGQEGEVLVRGPSVMLGYVADPLGQATSAVLDADGWYHTGDLGYYDHQHFIFLTDRIKDLIKVKGFQVSPSQLEKVVLGCPGVAEAAVTGVPSQRYGEAPRAWVVPQRGAHLQPEAVQQFVAERTGPLQQLTGGVQVVAALPRNTLGKVLKKQLRQSYLAQQAKL